MPKVLKDHDGTVIQVDGMPSKAVGQRAERRLKKIQRSQSTHKPPERVTGIDLARRHRRRAAKEIGYDPNPAVPKKRR